MPETKKEKWLGGYKRQGKRGVTYVIERWIDGVHWHVSTKCRTERAAVKELEKFEADPKSYRRARTAKTAGVEMTPELVAEYLEHMGTRRFDRGYIRAHKTYLGEVMVALAGRDLSRMSAFDLNEILDRATDQKLRAAVRARRIATRSFCKWLRRKKGKLTQANDPSLELEIETTPPEKHRRRKAMPLELVERAIQKMDPDVADVAIVLAATGLHIRELRRLHAGEGGIHEAADWQEGDGVLMNVAVKHKNRDENHEAKTHVVAITDQTVADAVRRVVARKEFPTKSRITNHDLKVSKLIGEKFSMGWMRHSLATWLAKQRVSEQDIANQLGHSSTKMARSTYIDLGLSARPVPAPRLRLVKG